MSQKSKSSKHTKASRHSSRSTMSMNELFVQKRMESERAKENLQYAKKEADLRRKQAQLEEEHKLATLRVDRIKSEFDTDLQLLDMEKEAAMVAAELKVLEEINDTETSVDNISLPEAPEDAQDRTRRYVDQLDEQPRPDVTKTPTPIVSEKDGRLSVSADRSQWSGSPPKLTHAYDLNPDASAYYPPQRPDNRSMTAVNDMTSELSRFFLKKELLFSRLTKFDDRPESYAVWKSRFQDIMRELGVSPAEELDLLIKWLGSDSSRHAHSLRAANARDPNRGLAQVWARLDDRFGSPEMVEAALKSKLHQFPKLTKKDNKKLYDLADIVSEIESIKEDSQYSALLAYFDTSSGVIPIVNKLPVGLQEKWTNVAWRYKVSHGVAFPPFGFFADFLREISRSRNDPSFAYDTAPAEQAKSNNVQRPASSKPMISAKKTEAQLQPGQSPNEDPSVVCPVHRTKHPLNACKGFRSKPIEERKKLIKEFRICYKCCASNSHIAKNCEKPSACQECNSDKHPTALHISQGDAPRQAQVTQQNDASAQAQPQADSQVKSVCTQICGEGFHGKSCAKTILVKVYPKEHPENMKQIYVILDEQSNASLARSSFFDIFQVQGSEQQYTLSSCAGRSQVNGRYAAGFVIEAVQGGMKLDLPNLLECDNIPDFREEIPTPEVVAHYHHLSDLSNEIPPLNPEADILLLVGRDLPEVHHVLEQRIGQQGAPYAQKLSLGWVVVGEVCLGKFHTSEFINVNKTHFSADRPSLMKPCENSLVVNNAPKVHQDDDIGCSLFLKTKDDHLLAPSIEDKKFTEIMSANFKMDPTGNWIAPLPFREPRPQLPNNRGEALRRAKMLTRSLTKDVKKRGHFQDFMEKIFINKHAELATGVAESEEVWYLPLFGVYHPKKPDQIRVVFDSSAQHKNVSLNSVLLRGPDMTNSLLGVLICFRENPVAVTADIQQMFYSFKVRPDHRRYLRFFWYEENDFSKDLVEYQMTVHVFGNSPSPAIATYGLRLTAACGEKEFGADIVGFVNNQFYVDDGLASFETSEAAVDMVRRTQEVLKRHGNLRLHKIASNKRDVMTSFDNEDLASNLKDLSFDMDSLPTHHSLGLTWDLMTDSFVFNVSQDVKPYTRRGVLSTINGLFDPFGFAAPVTIEGKLLLREITMHSSDWDDPLSKEQETEWEHWRNSLKDLQNVKIPRTYTKVLWSKGSKILHVYCDASEKAVASVAYLQTTDENKQDHVGFVLGKAKVAPKHGHTIPRLELCAAVMAVEMAVFITEHLELDLKDVQYHTDSRIVLGYICNESRRFYVYVANRVHRIRNSSNADQWNYVPTGSNPADLGTRSVTAKDLQYSSWLSGPPSLKKTKEEESHPLVLPDAEVRPVVITAATHVENNTIQWQPRFERFSSWKKLVRAFATLKSTARKQPGINADILEETENWILKQVQNESYSREVDRLTSGKNLRKDSPILKIDPYLDQDGLLHVGGRLNRADVPSEQRNPIIVPARHHIGLLLVRHYHESIQHQGRHFTEGAIRTAGFWIVGGKRLIYKVLSSCVKCQKLRGKASCQKMSDLPEDRLTPAPPFTCVGVDAFGPWSIITRKTRGGQANSKRWAILFTCLTIRAVHIEVVEEMSSSSFINALRRFMAVRGKVKIFRSDRGTNFVGAIEDLKYDAINVEDGRVQELLDDNGTKWIFNPPHASHMGGVWERLIGVARRILDSMLMDLPSRNLTHEVLVTLMSEVSAIINARPLVPVSSDAEFPLILSPATLLTQKIEHSTKEYGTFETKDLYKAEWKRVQHLADTFWSRWKKEYINTLQGRRKWNVEVPNIKKGELVLMVEKSAPRNEWPMGVVVNPLPGADGLVRKAEVKTYKNGQCCTYTRPVTELILISK